MKKNSELGVKFSKNKISCDLFADNFVQLAETGSALKILIDIVIIIANFGDLKPM